MEELVDLIIIGSGPAGVSAALTANNRNVNFLWFGSRNLSNKIEKAHKIINYPGLPSVTGEEMKEAFKSQVEELGIEIINKKINGVTSNGAYYMVSAQNQIYKTKTIIFATGVENQKELPGEAEFLGKGVSYCATCDGFFYRGRNIAIICTNPEYEDEVDFLADIAGKVDLFVTYKNCSIEKENVVIHDYREKPVAITGSDLVEQIHYKGDKEPLIDVNGVFILRDSISPATLLSGIETENGHIVVNRKQQTNLPGVFAAGDCTGRPYQYAKAVGEGNVAVFSVLEFLTKENHDLE